LKASTNNMSEQQPNGTAPEQRTAERRADPLGKWAESEWFKTWLNLARKGGNHPAPNSPRDGGV